MSWDLWEGRVCQKIRDNGSVMLETLYGHEYRAATVLLSGRVLTGHYDKFGFSIIHESPFWTRFWRGDIGDNRTVLQHAAFADRYDSLTKKSAQAPALA